MALLWTVLSFFITPRVVLTHLIAAGLLAGLFRDGVGPKTLAGLGFLEEIVAFLLWIIIPNSFSTIIAIWFCIRLYEYVLGPRVQVFENAVLVSEEDISNILKSTSPNIELDITRDAKGRHLLNTKFPFVVLSPRKWGQASEEQISQIHVDEVTGVEEGCDYGIVRAVRSRGSEPRLCFHVNLGGVTTVTFLCPTGKVRDDWMKALFQLYGRRMEDLKTTWLRQLFKVADVQAIQGNVSLEEATSLLEKAKRPMDRGYVKDLYNSFAKQSGSKSSHPSLTIDQFGKFFDNASRRIEIEQVFNRLMDKAKGEIVLNPVKFSNFLKEEQKENIPMPLVREWIKGAETILPSYNLTCIGFTNLMLSQEHSIFNSDCSTIYQDMDQPMSQYFIATSHNTYLTKDQLKSKSSVDQYINVLKRGCRCVELDCWDGPNNEPIIYHGHTLTSKILFKDVVKAIGEHAFDVSDYPVILSFENHCSVEQQRVMAEHLKNLLGPKLYTRQPADTEKALPSPNALRGYILVKAKKHDGDEVDDEFDCDVITAEDLEELEREKRREDEAKKLRNGSCEDEDDEFFDDGGITVEDLEELDKEKGIEQAEEGVDDASWLNAYGLRDMLNRGSIKMGTLAKKLKFGIEDDEDDEFDDEDITDEALAELEKESTKDEGEEEEVTEKKVSGIKGLLSKATIDLGRFQKEKKTDKVPKIAAELSDLVAYCQAVAFKGFNYSKENHKHYEMSSFAEKRAFKFARDDVMELLSYNRLKFSRIYPAGARIDSSNYDPLPLWNVGCQLVALNYQTPCRSMQLNHGLFQDNNRCGFVLKPDFMRNDNSKFDPRGPFDDSKSKYVSIRIITGNQLPYQNENKLKERNLLVEVRIGGVEADNQKEKTKVVKNNGFTPSWNDVLNFKVYVPELAMITFTVKEAPNSFLGQYTIPMRCMMQGYRRVPLLTKHSLPLSNASLFVHVEIRNH